MKQTRRDFLWTAGAAGAVLAWRRAQDVAWPAQQVAAAGWEPGEESQLISTCLVCPARCGIRGRMVDGRLVAITGNPLHPVSRGGLCPRGIGGVQTLYHPDRLTAPRLRVGERGAGEWRTITQEEAIALIAERLGAIRTSGRPDSLALVAGHCDGSMRELWLRFLEAFGSPNYVADDYDDGTDAVMDLMHGIARRPGYDLDRSARVLSFGAPLFESWWSPLQAYVAFGGPQGEGGPQRRPALVQVDTRFSRTAAWAHEWVGVRPGTHAVLALGIAYVLINEELYDADFVARHVSGFEDRTDETGRVQPGYRSLVQRSYRTEEVSAITGVPVERIVALAKAFGEERPSVAICGPDVLLAPDGLLAGLAVHSLNVLAGNINRPGGVLFGEDPPLSPLDPPVLDTVARAGSARAAFTRNEAPFGRGDPPRRFAEAAASGAAIPGVLFLYYSNPLASSAQPDAWRSALSRTPFIVSFSPFLDETARYADLILPDLLPWERWQDGQPPPSFPYPVWCVVRPLVQGSVTAVHTGEAVLALARALGDDVARNLPWADFEALLRARAAGLFEVERGMAFGDAFERAHLRQMEERGWWLREHAESDAFWEDLVARGGWVDLFHDETDPAGLARTPDGRIALLPARLERVLDSEQPGRRPYVLSSTPIAPPEEFPLRLIPYRVSTLASGSLSLEPWLAEQPTVFADRHWRPWVEVNPATAARLGLEDNASVWIISARGRYRALLKVFPGAAPDTVCAPYGLRHPDGELANPLQLLDGSTDPLTGLPCWFTSTVRLERA
jgi:anaerobic selenocysteine-containing dehydrogenase